MSRQDTCEYCGTAQGTWDEEAGVICPDCLQARELIKKARAERYLDHDEHERHDLFFC